MRLKRQDLQSLELEPLANLQLAEAEEWVKQRQLYNYSSWLLPQLVALFGTWTRYECGKTTVVNNCKNDFQRACWRLTRVTRGLLVKNQTKQPEYAKLTPLVLLGFKRSKNISYTQWKDTPNLNWLVEPDLYEAIQPCEVPSVDRLLAIREQGLVYKSGLQAGEMRPAESTWQLYGIQDTELGDYPKLQQTILTQCWLAHPKHRRETMILDPNNWDQPPQPLITEPIHTKTVKQAVSDVPW
jgi:hypothetical protein